MAFCAKSIKPVFIHYIDTPNLFNDYVGEFQEGSIVSGPRVKCIDPNYIIEMEIVHGKNIAILGQTLCKRDAIALANHIYETYKENKVIKNSPPTNLVLDSGDSWATNHGEGFPMKLGATRGTYNVSLGKEERQVEIDGRRKGNIGSCISGLRT